MSKNRKVVTKSTTYTRSSRQQDEQVTNIVKLGNRNYKRVELIPRTVNQETYVSQLLDDTKCIVFATGPAGSGKSFLAVLAALKAYKNGDIQKIVITRPAVAADDEKHGFLPGDLTQKLLPWVAPIIDVIKEYYSPQEVQRLIEDEVIELAPLAFLRGRTFKNAFIIADEMQNSTVNSMKMLLTRIGDNSKMVITGDLNQHDRQFVKDNGLKDFIARVSQTKSESISLSDFNVSDVQRHPVIKEVLSLYKEI